MNSVLVIRGVARNQILGSQVGGLCFAPHPHPPHNDKIRIDRSVIVRSGIVGHAGPNVKM